MPSNKVFIIASYALTWVVVLAYAARLAVAGGRARAAYESATANGGKGGSNA